jgi:arylsulfatase A-like enzyme
MNRRRFLGLTAAATGAALWPRLARSQSATRPNILLLVTDDWGWPYYGFMRPEVGSCLAAEIAGCDLQQDPFCQPYRFPFPRTPNLDALVAGGICFPWGISTASRSTAARQSIQTGLNRRDLLHDGTFYVRRDHDVPAAVAAGGRVCMPLALEGLGYTTYGLGKWVVDGAPLSSHFNVNQPGSGAETLAQVNVNGPALFRGFLDGPAQRPEPWFVMFAPYMPHAPYPSGEPYDDTRFASPGALCGEKQVGLGDATLRRFLASCNRFDTMVGQLVADLEARGLRESTIIFYTTDHGAALIRGKASFYEDGLRTPIIANCPAPVGTPWRIPARGLHPAMVGTIDLMPTILDYAREGQSSIPAWVPDPADTARFPDALSFRPLASGATNEFRTLMFSNRDKGGDKAVREATYDPGTGALASLYKLYVSKAGKEKQLFDLLANPFENPKQSLLKDPAQASRIAALKQAIAAW